MKTILLRDFKCGTRKNIFLFVIAFMYSVIVCLYFYMMVQVKMKSGAVSDTPGTADFFLFMYGGMKEYIPSPSRPFQVPVLWMAIQVMVYFGVLLYPINDFYSSGSNAMMLYGSKTKWWISKCVWTVSQAIIIYAVINVGIIVTSTILGSGSEGFSNQITMVISGINIQDDIRNTLWLYIIGMPIIHSLTGVLIQVNIELFIGPVMSFAAVIAYEILSAYMMTEVLFGNYSMVFRLKGVVDNGLNPLVGVITQIIACLIVVYVGIWYVKRKDVLNRT